MLKDKDVFKVIGKTIENATGITYVFGDQTSDAPRPQGDYCVISKLAERPLGIDSTSYEDVNGKFMEKVTSNIEATYSVKFYKGDANYNAKIARMGMKGNFGLSLYRTIGLGFMGVSEVRNISTPLDKGWEHRSQWDIKFNIVETFSQEADYIADYTISGDFIPFFDKPPTKLNLDIKRIVFVIEDTYNYVNYVPPKDLKLNWLS